MKGENAPAAISGHRSDERIGAGNGAYEAPSPVSAFTG